MAVTIEARKSMTAGCSIVQSQESTIRIIDSILQGQAQRRAMLQLSNPTPRRNCRIVTGGKAQRVEPCVLVYGFFYYKCLAASIPLV